MLCLLLLISGDIEQCPCPGPEHEINADFADMLRGSGIKIFHQKIRGLYQNLGNISAFLQQHKKFHIFSLSETHIDDCSSSQIFKIPGYSFIHKDRENGSHGGVATYINESIPYTRRTDLKVKHLECIWLEIKFPHTKSFLFSVWYRSPSTSKFLPANFNDLLTTSLSLATAEEKVIILTGVFNCNYLTLFGMGFFMYAKRMGGGKNYPPPPPP